VTSRYEVIFISPDVLGVEATIRIDELYPSTIPRESPPAGYCGINSVTYLDADRTLLISDVARNFYRIDVETLDVAHWNPTIGND
jgi:hypothetical protein